MADTPYAITLQRDLTETEKALISFLLQQEAPGRLPQLEKIKVVGRCGCGKCPTVLLGLSQQSGPKLGPFKELANYVGKTTTGMVVGVALLEREDELAELEAWSPRGDDVSQWPDVASLERVS